MQEFLEKVCGSAGNVAGLVVALMYGFTSVGMTFINKLMLNTFNYDYQFFIMLSQMLFTVFAVETLRYSGFVTIPNYSFSRGRTFLFPSVFYGLHSVLCLAALTNMNIPMYSLMKRCTPFVTLLLGVLVLKKGPPGWKLAMSVGMITGGCFIAGYGDLAFDPAAYAFGAVSVLAQSLYLTLVQKSGSDFTTAETVHLNAYNNIPIMLTCSVLFGQLGPALHAFKYHNIAFVITFVTVISLGCLLNFLLFLCTTMNSALTTSITAALKSNISTLVGMFTFGGIAINVFTLGGIAINMVGGTWYTFIKYQDSRKKNNGNPDSKKHMPESGKVGNGVRSIGRVSEKVDMVNEVKHKTQHNDKANGIIP